QRHAGQDHLPEGRLQRKRTQRGRGLHHLDHVNPVWQGRVEPFPDLGYGTGSRKRELQVLGLARCAGRGRASVRDLRVRRESGGKGVGLLCPATPPSNAPPVFLVPGKPHPPFLGFPNNRGPAPPPPASLRPPLTRHAQAPVRPGTVGNGSSVAPVGPVWISVPMAGQTPQSKHGVQRQSSTSRAPDGSIESCQSCQSQSRSRPASR